MEEGLVSGPKRRRVGRGLLYVRCSDLTWSYCSNGSETLAVILLGETGKGGCKIQRRGARGEEGREMEPGTDASAQGKPTGDWAGRWEVMVSVMRRDEVGWGREDACVL